jgi:hypothetical protein
MLTCGLQPSTLLDPRTHPFEAFDSEAGMREIIKSAMYGESYVDLYMCNTTKDGGSQCTGHLTMCSNSILLLDI